MKIDPILFALFLIVAILLEGLVSCTYKENQIGTMGTSKKSPARKSSKSPEKKVVEKDKKKRSSVKKPEKSQKTTQEAPDASAEDFVMVPPPGLETPTGAASSGINFNADKVPDDKSCQTDERDSRRAHHTDDEEEPAVVNISDTESPRKAVPKAILTPRDPPREPVVLKRNSAYADKAPAKQSAFPPCHGQWNFQGHTWGPDIYNRNNNQLWTDRYPSSYDDPDLQEKLNKPFDADFKHDLANLNIPIDIQNEIKANGVYSKEDFVQSFREADIAELIKHADRNRDDRTAFHITTALRRYREKLSEYLKQYNENKNIRLKENAKKNRVTDARLEELHKNFVEATDRVVLDYVKPSAELIGQIEENFDNGKWSWIHLKTVRNLESAEFTTEESNNKREPR